MNPHKYFVAADLISNPLCGINTYKDTLNLATGACTRQIKKLVLTGDETFYRDKERTDSWRFYSDTLFSSKYNVSLCSHFDYIGTNRVNDTDDIGFSLFSASQFGCRCPKSVANTINELKSWLAQQNANGTPVTVWYVLAEPETETIAVPTGLSGTVEGYLNQSGTPTPEAFIYPTANTAKGWYNINAYKRSVLVWNTDTAYERSDGSWT